MQEKHTGKMKAGDLPDIRRPNKEKAERYVNRRTYLVVLEYVSDSVLPGDKSLYCTTLAAECMILCLEVLTNARSTCRIFHSFPVLYSNQRSITFTVINRRSAY